MTEQLEQIAISDLTPWSRNARTHSRKQIRQIAESIGTFGFTNPVLIDERHTILAGHGRVKPKHFNPRQLLTFEQFVTKVRNEP